MTALFERRVGDFDLIEGIAPADREAQGTLFEGGEEIVSDERSPFRPRSAMRTRMGRNERHYRSAVDESVLGGFRIPRMRALSASARQKSVPAACRMNPVPEEVPIQVIANRTDHHAELEAGVLHVREPVVTMI